MLLAAEDKRSFWENLRESGGKVQIPAVAYVFVVYASYSVAGKLDRAFSLEPGIPFAVTLADALLMAALLGPPRTWWIVLAGAFPAHLIEGLANQGSLGGEITRFLSNFIPLLAAVALLRRFRLWPPRLQTAADVIIFAASACAVSAFIGLCLPVTVYFAGGPDLSLELWLALFLSKIVSFVLVLPVVVAAVKWVSQGRRIAWQRFIEAVALGLCVVILSSAAFGFPAATARRWPALICLPLPCVLWAGVRFGVGGTSMCLLLVALCGAVCGKHGWGPFIQADPVQSALAFQTFLITLSVPLLVLAALPQQSAAGHEDSGGAVREFTDVQRKGFEDQMRSFCEEFGASANLRVNVTFEGSADAICTDVAQCCFRVVQSGLQHASRYGAAAEAQVKIAAGMDRLFVTLAENGDEPRDSAAIEARPEVLSMKRWVESLSGDFRIAKRETRGTLVMVVLPI